MNPHFKHIRIYASSLVFALVAVCVASLVVVSPASAQSGSTGSVLGQVADQQNAVIPGADVTLVDAATNGSRTTVTNEVGRYIFPNVAPGTYNLSVAMAGFSTTKISGQKVSIGETLTINVTLSVGAIQETVEVSAAAGSQLQMTNATVGSTIAADSLVLLPNIGRDATFLSTMQVGVTPSGQVAGTAPDQTTFQIDGGNNSDVFSGNNSYVPFLSSLPTGVVPTPIESVEEFKVGTVNQTADFNGSAGSQVQMVTKRGTNQLHGALYDYYFGSNVGAANNWLNNHTPSRTLGLPYTPLPAAHYNRFGAAAGGPMLPDFLGGKWYIFGNFEGYRYPYATAIEKTVPTPLMRAGVIQVLNSSGAYVPYNLNPVPVTVNGVTYQPATCGPQNTPCDPRGVGLNPVVSQIWSKYEPLPNDPSYSGGDTVNTQGYLTPMREPQSSNFFVARIDHDFSSKWHFMTSYRYYGLRQFTSSQIDIGGALPGDTLGQAVAKSTRPAKPSMLVAGLTGTLTPHLTNDFRFSFMREFWEWATNSAPPQLPGLTGAVEVGGESANALIPYNVNASSARERFWDSLTKDFRDDLTLLHGNHLFQFGGMYERNFDLHGRNDNGQGIMSSLVFQTTAGTGIAMSPVYQPAGLPTNQVNSWNTSYAEVLGLVNESQAMFTYSGSPLTLNPLGTPVSTQAIVPEYSAYFTDSWHMRPTFTLTYGLGYMLEMPPYAITGNDQQLVGVTDNPISTADYLAARERAALAGQVFDPLIGFATTTNIGAGMKYVYRPYYGGFSPRVAGAWNPKFGDGILGKVFGHGDTVIRGGYSRILGRLNGINQVSMPILGAAGVDPTVCIGASTSGQCLGAGGATPTTAFRMGVDGMTAPMPVLPKTLSQPVFPGTGSTPEVGDTSMTDINYRVNRSDQFNLSIQRALSQRVMIEVGYIGRIIRNENEETNLDAVPYMLTLNGQRFDNAFANLYTALSAGQAIQAQPFLEAAMGGANSAYCANYGSCTAAVAAKLKSTILATQVYNLWSTLSQQSSWTLGRTMISSTPAQSTSIAPMNSNGWGNYNAGYASVTVRDWHGLGARSNFTWNRAFGTGSIAQSGILYNVDSYDSNVQYGPQPFDIRFIYNLMMTYQSPYYKNQHGLLGHLLGGWSLAPIFTAQSGAPLEVSLGTGSNTDVQSFGEMYSNTAQTYENAVLTVPYTGGNSAHYNVLVTSGAGINGNASKGGSGVNMFSDPNAIYGEFRRLILGIDHNAGGAGRIRGMPQWNMDMSVAKEFHATERVGATLSFQFYNIMNHFQPANPTLNLDSPQTWGVISSQANMPRQMEFGLRIRF